MFFFISDLFQSTNFGASTTNQKQIYSVTIEMFFLAATRLGMKEHKQYPQKANNKMRKKTKSVQWGI